MSICPTLILDIQFRFFFFHLVRARARAGERTMRAVCACGSAMHTQFWSSFLKKIIGSTTWTTSTGTEGMILR